MLLFYDTMARVDIRMSDMLANPPGPDSHLGKLFRDPPIDREACWIWPGKPAPNGYAHATVGVGLWTVLAHRATYTWFRGAIPDGLHLDHLCRTPACVNPWHLEPVTAAENTRRDKRARGLFGHVRRLPSGRWNVRVAGRSATFDTRDEAKAWLTDG